MAIGHELLDVIRRRPFLRKIAGDKKWEELILEILRATRFDIAALFEQRVRDHARLR